MAVFLGLLALAPPAWSFQEPVAQAPPVQPEAPPEYLASPRAAISYFLLNKDGAPSRAGEIFDLSGVSTLELPVRRERLADLLTEVLDRTEVVDPTAFPPAGADELEDERFWSYERRVFRGLVPLHLVSLTFEHQDDGAWRVTKESAEGLQLIYDRIADLPYVEGLRDRHRQLRWYVKSIREKLVPSSLRGTGFLLQHWQWLGLGLLLFLCAALDRVSRWIATRLVKRVVGKVKLDLGADTANFVRPVGIFAAALTFRGLLWLLELEPGHHATLELSASFVLTITGVWSAYRLVDLVCGVLADRAARTRNKFDDVLVPLLRRTLKILVVIAAMLYVASIWTDTLWQVLASVSVGSIALTFAAKDSIENLFGTFTVLLDKPFQLGDWIVAGGVEGTVEVVGFRSTRVRTFYNSVITIPNRTFIGTAVDNMGVRRYRRVKAVFGLTYDTPPEKIEGFCEALRELIRTHPYTRKDYYHVYLNGYGPSSLDVLLYAFFEVPDWATELREKHRLFNDILRVAGELGVSFAFPTQSIQLVKPEDLEHPSSPETIDEGLRAGRAAAHATTETSLAGLGPQGPPPPSMEGPDPDWRLGE